MAPENFSPSAIMTSEIEDQAGPVGETSPLPAVAVEVVSPAQRARAEAKMRADEAIARVAEARRIEDEQRVAEARRRWSGVLGSYAGSKGTRVEMVRAWIGDKRGFRIVRRAADGAEVGFEELVPIDGAALLAALDRAFAALREGGTA